MAFCFSLRRTCAPAISRDGRGIVAVRPVLPGLQLVGEDPFSPPTPSTKKGRAAGGSQGSSRHTTSHLLTWHESRNHGTEDELPASTSLPVRHHGSHEAFPLGARVNHPRKILPSVSAGAGGVGDGWERHAFLLSQRERREPHQVRGDEELVGAKIQPREEYGGAESKIGNGQVDCPQWRNAAACGDTCSSHFKLLFRARGVPAEVEFLHRDATRLRT